MVSWAWQAEVAGSELEELFLLLHVMPRTPHPLPSLPLSRSALFLLYIVLFYRLPYSLEKACCLEAP